MSGTPGPWRLSDGGGIYGGEDRFVALCSWHLWDREERAIDEADARLIAAAPRFLAAADTILMMHAAYRSEAGEGMCGCDACALLRPLVEALS